MKLQDKIELLLVVAAKSPKVINHEGSQIQVRVQKRKTGTGTDILINYFDAENLPRNAQSPREHSLHFLNGKIWQYRFYNPQCSVEENSAGGVDRMITKLIVIYSKKGFITFSED